MAILRRLSGTFLNRCPRCFQGSVFSGPFRMRERCPSCGANFQREDGYFIGAVVLHYFIQGVLVLPVFLVLLLRGTDFKELALVVGAEMGVLTLALYRFTRLLWMHFDHQAELRLK